MKNHTEPILYIFRGLPGSGKTTRAIETVGRSHWFENDQFFMDSDGNYNYDSRLLPEAIADCLNRLEQAMAENKTPLAITGTFIRLSHMDDTKNLARRYGYRVRIVTCQGDYGNVHGVPDEVLARMKSEFEPLEKNWRRMKRFRSNGHSQTD